MKLEQIAFGCAAKDIWERFAEKAEVVDEVNFSGIFKPLGLPPKQIKDCVGYLAFDYKLGIEREYLYYPQSENTFHILCPGNSDIFLSHLAYHVSSIDYILTNPAMVSRVVMDVITNHHTNEKLQELGRKYRYVIIDTRTENGYFTKLIQRIEKPAGDIEGSSTDI